MLRRSVWRHPWQPLLSSSRTDGNDTTTALGQLGQRIGRQIYVPFVGTDGVAGVGSGTGGGIVSAGDVLRALQSASWARVDAAKDGRARGRHTTPHYVRHCVDFEDFINKVQIRFDASSVGMAF